MAKGAQATWRLPSRTHSNLLPLISGCIPFFDEFCRRFINFAYICLHHKPNIVQFVASHGLNHSRSECLVLRKAIAYNCNVTIV